MLADVPPTRPAAREELFGPVATLFRARDADHALALANDSRFGLGASVWTATAPRPAVCAASWRPAGVHQRAWSPPIPRFPFGGIKHSGYGRELGPFGLREFVNVKTVRMKQLPR